MGPLGVPEMIFIFVLALLILGPKKLPEVGRAIGKGMAEFRRASNELRNTFDREMHAMERENESVKEVTSSYTPSTYDYPYDDYSYSQETTSSASAPQAAESHTPVHTPGEHPVTGSEAKS